MPEDKRMKLRVGKPLPPKHVFTTSFEEVVTDDGGLCVIVKSGDRRGCVTGIPALTLRDTLRQLRAAAEMKKQTGEAT